MPADLGAHLLAFPIKSKRKKFLRSEIKLPLYEYLCDQCGYRFEKIQKFNSQPETVCPKCGGDLRRPLTAPALQFKGAGWYVNDYAPKGVSKTADKPAGDGAKPATSEAKPAESKPAGGESSPKPASTQESKS
jgi:putative FmdB family regulatory protein